MRVGTAILTGALLLAAGLSAPGALAQETKSAAASARTFYQEGIDLTAAGRLGEAEAKFLEAWALQKSYDVAANLGEVSIRLEKPAEAAYYFKFALANFPASGQENKRLFLEKRLVEAKAKAASVTVVVNVPGAEVRINGKPAGKAPIEGAVFVAPGDCTVEVTAPDLEPFRQTIRASAGGSHEVRADLAPPAKSPVPGIVAGGVGVAGMAAGVALFLVSIDKYDASERLYDQIAGGRSGPATCAPGVAHPKCAELKSTAELSDTLYASSLALMIGGAMLTAGGAGYFGYALSTSPPPAAGGRPTVTRVGLRGTGFFVSGSF